jgi:hypothetical protein
LQATAQGITGEAEFWEREVAIEGRCLVISTSLDLLLSSSRPVRRLCDFMTGH